MLDVHPSGYYAWQIDHHSEPHKANLRLTGWIKHFWLESGGVYGYRKLHSNLREVGEESGINGMYGLMRAEGLKAQVGYRKPRHRGCDSHIAAPNRLQRQFNPMALDEA